MQQSRTSQWRRTPAKSRRARSAARIAWPSTTNCCESSRRLGATPFTAGSFSMAKVQRALLSVFDKTGLVPFAQVLAEAGVELISTGGTARILREHGLKVKDLSEHTGFPEMLDGRVKTLHPKIHGGLLYIRGNEEHEEAAHQHGIGPIDVVVVNLYPFEQTIAKPGVTLEDA